MLLDFGAVAQAWSECVPLIVIPAGSSRREAWVKPGFNATLNYQHITKSAEMITTADQLVPAMRRAYTQARNGRPGPCLIEVPGDMWNVEVPGTIDYVPVKRYRSARIIAAGHAFVQNLRRGHYDVATETPARHRLRIAFDELALTI